MGFQVMLHSMEKHCTMKPKMQKIGFHSKFVERALELGFTTKENIDFWQRVHACVTNCHV